MNKKLTQKYKYLKMTLIIIYMKTLFIIIKRMNLLNKLNKIKMIMRNFKN